MHNRAAIRARLTGFITVLAVAMALLAAPPATAAPAAPGGLTPSGESLQGIPVLTWNRVPGATGYNVELSDSSAFSTIRYKVSTSNRRATPTVQLGAGEIWWRVRAVGPTGTGEWSIAQFDRTALAGPTLTAPVDGATLAQPTEPALLSWTPVNGATGYTVEIDDAADFIGATKYTTKTSSYVVPNPQIARDYYWRVQATVAAGIVTDYSEIRTYRIGGLSKPILVGPENSPTNDIEDVVLEWQPVPGAVRYDLQIDTDENFLSLDHFRNGIVGTRYSPPTTLNNDQYFWRVRPVDAQGNQLDFTAVDVWQFRRHWPDQPQLEYPIQDDIVGDPFFYQWTPVEHASRYVVQLSTSNNFTNLVDSCSTVHTTYVPSKGSECWPGAAGTYYWRVLAYDDPYPGGVVSEAIFAQVERFSYLPDMVDLSTATPADGDQVAVPTLTWAPVPEAAEYRVYITAIDGGAGSVNGAVTHTTSYTPRGLLTVGKTYRWWVQTVSDSGRPGATLIPEAQSTFTVVAQDSATASAPDPISPSEGFHAERFPTLRWTPVVGADRYRIGVRPANTVQAFTELPDTFFYPAGEDDRTDYLAADTYEWQVSAYSGATKLSSGEIRTFEIKPVTTVTGQRAAMTGESAQSPATSCAAVLPARCIDMRQTPVLRWDPVPGAGAYKVVISRDANLTNVFRRVTTDASMYVPVDAFADSQAGDAYYWQVQPCKNSGACNAETTATHAFNKLSHPVELLSPADGAPVADDVTFTWTDYLATNSKPARVDSTGVNPRIEARSYRVQVSTVPNFQTILETVDVDQTTFTSFARAYPEGTLYWRVLAIDGTRNVLTSSAIRTITKSSNVPTLLSPINNVAVGQTAPFRWQPLDFAASYDVEVFKNGDTIGQAANRVVAGNSKQVAFTTTVPLPASDTPYTWRVRRVDASGNKGAWTSLEGTAARFRINGSAPVLVSPLGGVKVTANDSLFTWQAVDGATSYRFERRAAGQTSIAEVVGTVATAWAPAKTITDGRWEWRVSSLDAGGKVLASSPWRGFTVDGTRPTVTSVSPADGARVRVRTNFKAVFSEPVTNVTTKTVKLFRKGSRRPILARVTLSADRRTAVLNPNRNLRRGKVYIAKVTSGVRDLSGLTLVPKSWSVTTR